MGWILNLYYRCLNNVSRRTEIGTVKNMQLLLSSLLYIVIVVIHYGIVACNHFQFWIPIHYIFLTSKWDSLSGGWDKIGQCREAWVTELPALCALSVKSGGIDVTLSVKHTALFSAPCPHSRYRLKVGCLNRLYQIEFPSEPVTNSVVAINILFQFCVFVFVVLYLCVGVLTETNYHVQSLMTHLCYKM